MTLQEQITALDPAEPLIVKYIVNSVREFETLEEYYEDEYATMEATVYYEPDYYGGADLEELAMSRAEIRFDEDAPAPVQYEISGDWDDMESSYRRFKRIEDNPRFIEWGELIP